MLLHFPRTCFNCEVFLHCSTRCSRKTFTLIRVLQQLSDCRCKCSLIPRLNQQTIHAMLNSFRRSSYIRCNHRYPTSHCFSSYQCKRFLPKRGHEHNIRAIVMLDQFVLRNPTVKSNGLRELPITYKALQFANIPLIAIAEYVQMEVLPSLLVDKQVKGFEKYQNTFFSM